MAAGISSASDVKFPQPRGFVNDYAGVLTGTRVSTLDNMIAMIKDKTKAEVAVVTVRTTAPLTIEQYAVDLFKTWGIGTKGSDNGVLLLVATDDRKVRIEVGYGLEGSITDLESKLIIDRKIIPYFKQGNYAGGIYAGVVAISGLLEKEYGVVIDLDKVTPGTLAQATPEASPGSVLFSLLVFILIFGFRFGTVFFLMNRRGTYWSSGSRGSFGGGGFGGFGGGFSGGGGASGGW